MAEGSVPGGQLCAEPPQQAHRNPSMAQCRQYSQVCGSPGSAPVPGEARAGDSPRATGNRGTLAAPHNRSEEHTSELQSRVDLVCRLLLEKKKKKKKKKENKRTTKTTEQKQS